MSMLDSPGLPMINEEASNIVQESLPRLSTLRQSGITPNHLNFSSITPTKDPKKNKPAAYRLTPILEDFLDMALSSNKKGSRDDFDIQAIHQSIDNSQLHLMMKSN